MRSARIFGRVLTPYQNQANERDRTRALDKVRSHAGFALRETARIWRAILKTRCHEIYVKISQQSYSAEGSAERINNQDSSGF